MTGPMHMPCDKWSEKLAAKIDTLAPAERAALEAHLAICPVCSLAQADYQMMRRLLHTLPAPAFSAEPPPRLLHLWEKEDGNNSNEEERQHSLSLAVEPWFQMALQEAERIKSNELSPDATQASNTSSVEQGEALVDQILHCSVCDQDFLFTASDQAFFLQRGNLEKPKRCPSCLRTRMHGGVPLDHPYSKRQ